MYTELSRHDCAIIANKIRENIYEPVRSFKTSIFLCGADLNKDSTVRHKFTEVINGSIWYSMMYDIIFPEDIFDDMLYGSNSTDLLSLENLLADSVDAVVIIPESPGSLAELGAFANNDNLRSKLICIIDEKYRRDKSFISQGPLKLVKKYNKNAIIYIDPAALGVLPNNLDFLETFKMVTRDKEMEKILTAIRKLKKNSISENKITLLQLDKFLLPAIYLLEPVTTLNLKQIVAIAIDDETNSSNFVSAALSMLIKRRFVELTTEGYKLTKLGTKTFLEFRKKYSRIKDHNKTIAIDSLRLEILNLKNRKKKLKV